MTAKRDPSLIWRPLSEHDKQPLITPRQWIVHTAVDGPGPTDLGDYFERAAVTVESHTWLRWSAHEQLMDFDRSADANFKANRFYVNGVPYGAISTETEDDGTPEQRPWNQYQLDELVRFGVWLNRMFGIPPRLCRTWDDWGMGWHAMFPMVWSNARGKTCPGSTRIRQFNDIVLPRIQLELSGLDLTLSQYTDIMDKLGAIELRVADLQNHVKPNNNPETNNNGDTVFWNTHWTKGEVVHNHKQLDRIVEHLGIEPTNPPAPA